jgi:hypothetical protein
MIAAMSNNNSRLIIVSGCENKHKPKLQLKIETTKELRLVLALINQI